jgi:hypothetical protein
MMVSKSLNGRRHQSFNIQRGKAKVKTPRVRRQRLHKSRKGRKMKLSLAPRFSFSCHRSAGSPTSLCARLTYLCGPCPALGSHTHAFIGGHGTYDTAMTTGSYSGGTLKNSLVEVARKTVGLGLRRPCYFRFLVDALCPPCNFVVIFMRFILPALCLR